MSTPITGETAWPELQRTRRAIVVVDVVESVRLMQAHEADVIDRWRRFVAEVRTEVLPKHGGRLVKSLGDGMLVEFQAVPSAAMATLDIQHRAARMNSGRAADDWLWLRAGAHVGGIVADDLDIYGDAVNMAARLAGIALAGQCVCSVEFRDELAPGVHLSVEDLGECFVKHSRAPMRCFTFSKIDHDNTALPLRPATGDELLPGIAVLPFSVHGGQAVEQALGDAICDDIIAALSQRREWRVISRLSTAALRGTGMALDQIGATLCAGYVVDGAASSPATRFAST